MRLVLGWMQSTSDLEVSYNTVAMWYCIVCFNSFPDAPEVTARVYPPSPVIKGTIVNLVCEVTAGDFPISFSWTSSNEEGLSSDSINGNISVSFCAREDYGIYTCTATNPFGSHTSQVEIAQAGIKINYYITYIIDSNFQFGNAQCYEPIMSM